MCAHMRRALRTTRESLEAHQNASEHPKAIGGNYTHLGSQMDALDVCTHAQGTANNSREVHQTHQNTPKRLEEIILTSAKLWVEEPHRLWNHADVSDIRTHTQSIRINAKMTAKNMKMSANL